MDHYLLCFSFLKIVDAAIKFSKKEIVETRIKYESKSNLNKIILQYAQYPNGEQLGFYNSSNWDLNKLSLDQNNILTNLKEYILGFDKDIQEVLICFELENMIQFLYKNDLLFLIIEDLSSINISSNDLNSRNSLSVGYDNFLNEFFNFIYRHEKNVNLIYELLSKILLRDLIIENNPLKIFDPTCGDGFSLFLSKNILLKDNSNLNIELFGQEHDKTLYGICLSKFIIDNENTSNVKLFDNAIFNFIDDDEKRYDLIISNFAEFESKYHNDILKFNSKNFIFEYLMSKLNNNGKMVITLTAPMLDLFMPIINSLIFRDKLESIIALPLYSNGNYNIFILVMNNNKPKNKKDKFLLIDESDFKVNFNNYQFSALTKSLNDRILESYSNFTEYENSRIVNNSEITDISSQFLSRDFGDDSVYTHAEYILNFNDLMYDKKRPVFENLLFKQSRKNEERKFIEDSIKIVNLTNIADLNVLYQKNDSNSLLISTFKHENNKIVYKNSEINYLNPGEYIECNINDYNVDLEYLYYYLNSNKGYDEISYFSRGNIVNPENLKYLRIPIPPIKIQKEIVKVVKLSNEFFDSVEMLKNEFQDNILDYKRMNESINQFIGDQFDFDEKSGEFKNMSRNWKHVYQGLLWPLAISYLSATKGSFEISEKADKYLILFEFITLFNCIILLSGIPNDVYQNIKYEIWNARNKKIYEEMTFGKWYILSQNLSRVYRENEFETPLDLDLFLNLSSENILDLLEKAKDLRNKHRHGSFKNHHEAQSVVDELDIYLNDVFDILKIYTDYKMFYVTEDFKRKNGKFVHSVILLNGPCAQPIYDSLIFNELLDENSLYLYHPKNNKIMKIKDNLMKFSPVDENCLHWALFVYYKCDRIGYMKTNALYKCFQHEEDDLIEHIETFSKNIMG